MTIQELHVTKEKLEAATDHLVRVRTQLAHVSSICAEKWTFASPAVNDKMDAELENIKDVADELVKDLDERIEEFRAHLVGADA